MDEVLFEMKKSGLDGRVLSGDSGDVLEIRRKLVMSPYCGGDSVELESAGRKFVFVISGDSDEVSYRYGYGRTEDIGNLKSDLVGCVECLAGLERKFIRDCIGD